MEIRKFRSAYDLELIPASHEGISLGDLVWDPLIGPPEFSKKGMPNTIYSAFLDAGLIVKTEWEIFRDECRNSSLAPAGFATRTVEVNMDSVNELKHPMIGKIKGDFRINKLGKFIFGDLQVREMDDLIRIKIDRFLEQMKASRWSEYDGNIRRVFLITELYYGAIQLVVKKQFSTELELILEETGLETRNRSEGTHAVMYEFSHDNVPFAMRIERVRHFNG